jgi:nitroimidazol reductase NimA-like FMN-containing flavoprotein (pyridoxamine 5'-phosphate oxidase superfamily)
MKDVDLAKRIIERILYITVATITPDGKPWSSPLYSAFDKKYNFYWASDRNGQHSKNIRNNPDVFITIFDSGVPEGSGRGVYVQAVARELSDEKGAEDALTFLYGRAGKNSKKRGANEFLGGYPRRVYKAAPEKFWINGDGKVNGNYVDIRKEMKLP